MLRTNLPLPVLCLGWMMLLGLVACTSAVDKAGDTTPPLPSSARQISPILQRGLWVTRWDYRTAEEIATIMANCAALGITDVLFQVRGQADAFYASELEPWGQELLHDGKPPEFDPLELACLEAHKHGLRLHAWVNAMPLWKGTQPPVSQKHLIHTQPDWRLLDKDGQPQPLHDHYVIVNPLLPQVREHLRKVFTDIVTRYPVDGLHLDYIRFVSESMDKALNYPADSRSRELFTQATGKRAEEDVPAWRQFKRDCVTELVRGIREDIKAVRDQVTLSAAVWHDPDIAFRDYLQDYRHWLEEGLLDVACPMIYTTDMARYQRNLAATLSVRAHRKLAPGLGIYRHDDPAITLDQMKMALEQGADGLVLFAYDSLFVTSNPNQDRSPQAMEKRRVRLAALKEFFTANP